MMAVFCVTLTWTYNHNDGCLRNLSKFTLIIKIKATHNDLKIIELKYLW